MFITALFTIAKTWKQPKCPLMDEWIKKIWYIYTMELLTHNNEKLMPFAATGLQLIRVLILSESEGNQKEKDKHHMLSLICGI